MKLEKNLIVDFNAPLLPNDTEKQTVGCRHSNPDICGSNSLMNVCAFARSDGMCTKPSTAWKKQYIRLLKGD